MEQAAGRDLEGEDRSNALLVMKHMADLVHAVCKQAPAVMLQPPLGIPTLMRLCVPGFQRPSGRPGVLVLDLSANALTMQSLSVVRCGELHVWSFASCTVHSKQHKASARV